MNKALVLYKSKYGSTKQYVGWIQEAVCCDVFEVHTYDYRNTDDYDAVILAGGIYAGGISVIKAMADSNFKALAGKKIAVLAVGASPYDESAMEALKSSNLKNRDIPIFYARGAYDEHKMKLGDRTLCKIMTSMLKRKDPSTYEPWMAGLIEADGAPCDWTDRKNLGKLIAYITG